MENVITKNVLVDANGCWIWQKSCMTAGYGQVWVDGIYWGTHRLAYTIYKGPIKDEELVRHSCHNVKCCNPEHLSVGNHKDNYADSVNTYKKAAVNRRKTWIINGVVFSTCREAKEKTGISFNSLIKFTKDGVFNVEEYREACRKGGWPPKL